jgi:hypothetical protein
MARRFVEMRCLSRAQHRIEIASQASASNSRRIDLRARFDSSDAPLTQPAAQNKKGPMITHRAFRIQPKL